MSSAIRARRSSSSSAMCARPECGASYSDRRRACVQIRHCGRRAVRSGRTAGECRSADGEPSISRRTPANTSRSIWATRRTASWRLMREMPSHLVDGGLAGGGEHVVDVAAPRLGALDEFAKRLDVGAVETLADEHLAERTRFMFSAVGIIEVQDSNSRVWSTGRPSVASWYIMATFTGQRRKGGQAPWASTDRVDSRARIETKPQRPNKVSPRPWTGGQCL